MQRVEVPLLFSQEQFDEFARLSGDDNPIHVDAGFAAGTRFGRTVAHGMFLFSVMNSVLARRHGFRPTYQELLFNGPTFAGEPMSLVIEAVEGGFRERLLDPNGEQITSGLARSTPPPPVEAGQIDPLATHKGLRIGMSASLTRVFSNADVDAYRDLVDDPGDTTDVPGPLLGGLVSALLGVDLPGPGANWLKQRYAFVRPVPIGAQVRAEVTVVRIRSAKELVNLSATVALEGEAAVVGESLVLVKDVAG